jgi:hypothetical protein
MARKPFYAVTEHKLKLLRYYSHTEYVKCRVCKGIIEVNDVITTKKSRSGIPKVWHSECYESLFLSRQILWQRNFGSTRRRQAFLGSLSSSFGNCNRTVREDDANAFLRSVASSFSPRPRGRG